MAESGDDYHYASSDFENDSDEVEEDIDEPEEEEEEEGDADDGTDQQPNSLPRDSIENSMAEEPDFVRNIGVDVRSVATPESSSQMEDKVDEVEELSYTDPEVMLTKLQIRTIDGDFEVARVNRIRCLALCKIVYGERHWRVAEAHVQLANVYLKGKHYPQQVLKHTTIARDVLLSATKMDSFDESTKQYLLQNLYYLMGSANLKLGKYKPAENHFVKAKLVADHCSNQTLKFMKMKINILSSLASTLTKLQQVGQAIEHLEEGIEIAGKMSGSDRYTAIRLHKQVVGIELANRKDMNVPFAMEHALNALDLSVDSNGSEASDTAEIFLLVSRVEIVKDKPDYKSIEDNLQNALKIYTKLENHSKIVRTQEMISKVLLKQSKFSGAKSVLKRAIATTEEKFGDMSLQSGELYELMGNVLFAEQKLPRALLYFTRAEEIFRGKKRYSEKQEKLGKVMDVIRKSKHDKFKTSEAKMKERPRFT